MVGGVGVRIWGEVEEGGVGLGLLVPTLVVDEAAEVGGELGAEGAVWVDEHGLALLVEQVILAAFDVVAAWGTEYEYLCGCWEKIRLR